MDFLDVNNDVFDNMFGPKREQPLYQALYQSEERAFQVLEALEKPLSLRDSACCLRKAMLDGSVELFRKILENSEPGQCTEQYHLPAETPGWLIRGHGSLLMLAAMMERPRQAALLLEHGYDVNGSGLELSDYLRQDGKRWGDDVPRYANYCGSAGCQIMLHSPGVYNLGINCVTPLAAALLCGSLQTAELLLRRPNVWKEESSAVCRAAVMVLEGAAHPALSEERQRNQLEILRRIFFPKEETLPDRETILRSVYLQPAAFIDICRTGTLRHQLEGGLCGEEDARRMLDILSVDMWWRSGEYDKTRAGKLLLVKQYFPKLCREPWATGVFLREIVRRIRGNLPYRTMLNAWKQLCGKERDLTWIYGDIWMLNWLQLRKLLQEAGEGGTPVMDADAMKQVFGTGYRSMQSILKAVRFRFRDGEGVNGLMQHLMVLGDLRLLQQAARLGFFETEDPKLLMECLVETGNSRQDVRAMVLTYARNQPDTKRETADWRDPRRWDSWCLWEQLDEEGEGAVVDRFLRQELSRDDCLRTMFRLHQHLNRGFFPPDIKVGHPVYPQLQTDSLGGFACCAESTRPLELLREQMPGELLKVLRANWGERLFFCGTPLALAAALGRTEQVALLLAAGVRPDEAGRGDISRFFVRGADFTEEGFPVTPVLAAILFGQEETAKILLEQGAYCDFANQQHRKVLLHGSAETLALAAALPGVGFEKIPAEELEAIRIMTGPQGERTRFWESLRQSAEF